MRSPDEDLDEKQPPKYWRKRYDTRKSRRYYSLGFYDPGDAIIPDGKLESDHIHFRRFNKPS